MAKAPPPDPTPGDAHTERPPAAPPPGLPPELAQHPRFRVVRELGRGGMGVVYEAEHRMMERRVALKVINRSLLDHPDALARFHAEVKAAARLDHPNIVRAYDAEQAGELHLLVMEYVEGTDLAKVVARRGPLAVAHACHFVRQTALGLQHAHEQGMAHRDIKPQNLMLTPKGRVKVLDFGLARLRSGQGQSRGLTQEGAFMGTPEYVAPEQATDAREADIRADIYSLGCTLYDLLTGRPPFAGDTAVKLVLAHLGEEPPPLRQARPDAPAELEAVVGRMLAKDPARRYQTPAEVAQALAPFIKVGPSTAVPSEPAPPPEATAAGKGTMLPGDTKGIPPAARERVSEPPAKRAAPTAPAGSDFADLATPAPGRSEGKKAQQAPAAGWRRRWPLLAGIGGAAVVALAVLLGVVIKLKTRDGTDLPNAEALVDGRQVAAPGPQPAGKVLAYRHGGKWRVEGDELIQEDTSAGIPFILFGDPSWTDYDMTVEARRVEGTGLCAVPFRVESLLDFWMFGISETSRGVLAVVDGTRKPNQVKKGWTLDSEWHKLGVKVRGDQLQCFMDEASVFDVTDGRHPRGAVGLVAPNKSASRFRNLKVTDASGHVLVDGVPGLEFAAEEGDPPASDPPQAGTVWKGTLRTTLDGKYQPDVDSLLKVRKRQGTRFEGEVWLRNETAGLQIEGTIDGLGNITWKATAKLAGDGWPSNVLEVLVLGAVRGKQLRAVGHFGGPQNLIAEVTVTRED